MWVQKDKLTKHLSWNEVSDWVVNEGDVTTMMFPNEE